MAQQVYYPENLSALIESKSPVCVIRLASWLRGFFRRAGRERQPAAGFRLAGGEPAFVKIHLDSTEQRRARMETAPTDDTARGDLHICNVLSYVVVWILQSTPIVHKRSPRVQGRPPSLSPALSLRSSQEVKSDLVVSLMFGVTDVPPSTSIASSARL